MPRRVVSHFKNPRSVTGALPNNRQQQGFLDSFFIPFSTPCTTVHLLTVTWCSVKFPCPASVQRGP